MEFFKKKLNNEEKEKEEKVKKPQKAEDINFEAEDGDDAFLQEDSVVMDEDLLEGDWSFYDEDEDSEDLSFELEESVDDEQPIKNDGEEIEDAEQPLESDGEDDEKLEDNEQLSFASLEKESEDLEEKPEESTEPAEPEKSEEAKSEKKATGSTIQIVDLSGKKAEPVEEAPKPEKPKDEPKGEQAKMFLKRKNKKMFNVKYLKTQGVRYAIGVFCFLLGFILLKAVEKTVWAGLPFLFIAYVIIGADIYIKVFNEIKNKKFFTENFLMAIASLAAFICGEYPEAVIVMILFQIGDFLEDLALDRSRENIADLMNIRPDMARVDRGGLKEVHPSQVNVGERIVVRVGERVPLDGIVEVGESFIDASALTGESVPKRIREGEEILAGVINKRAPLTIRTTKLFGDSTASKILALVEDAAEKKAPAEKFITKFAKYYTPAVLAIAFLIALIPSIITKKWKIWIYRACIMLTISCPCALVISVPLAFFAGLGVASRYGVLIKGANYLDSLDMVNTVVFDKTGTLTKGVFKVTQISSANGFSEPQLLTLATYAEAHSNHPIARSIKEVYKKNGGKPLDRKRIDSYKEIDGHGVSVVMGEHMVLAGNAKLMRAANVSFTESTSAGTKVYIAVDGKFAGYLIISDEVKDDAKDCITELKIAGIEHTMMLTGDNEYIASNVAKEVGIEKYYADLLPDEKVTQLEDIMRTTGVDGGLTAFVGDGINDAPVLARADIGVAMGGIGSDAAVEAADIVIMDDNPSKLADAVNIARDTKMIVRENIIVSIAIKVILLILGALGIVGMWFAVLGDVGVMLLAVFNSMRLLKK